MRLVSPLGFSDFLCATFNELTDVLKGHLIDSLHQYHSQVTSTLHIDEAADVVVLIRHKLNNCGIYPSEGNLAIYVWTHSCCLRKGFDCQMGKAWSCFFIREFLFQILQCMSYSNFGLVVDVSFLGLSPTCEHNLPSWSDINSAR